MVKPGPKVRFHEGYKMVRVDFASHARLKRLSEADNLSIVGWLRVVLDLIERRVPLDSGQAIAAKFMAVSGVLSGRSGPSLLDRQIIASAMAENPEVTQAGWYKRRADGSWEFDYDGFSKWAKDRDEKFDRMYNNPEYPDYNKNPEYIAWKAEKEAQWAEMVNDIRQHDADMQKVSGEIRKQRKVQAAYESEKAS